MGRTYQSVVIDAPVDDVWAAVENFHDMSWAPNAVRSLQPVGDVPPDKRGAKRVLNEVFHETLLELDELNRAFRYRIDEAPEPISSREVENYTGTVRVLPVTEGGGTLVELECAWEGGNEDSAAFSRHINSSVLAELKRHFEG